MSSGRFRAGAVAGRALLIFTLFFASVSLRGQMYPGYPFGIPRGASGGWNRPFGYPAGEPRGLDITVPEFPPRPPAATAGTVSSDILRHPLSSKALRMLEKALRLSGVGNHPAAIEALRDALVKQPPQKVLHRPATGTVGKVHRLREARPRRGQR